MILLPCTAQSRTEQFAVTIRASHYSPTDGIYILCGGSRSRTHSPRRMPLISSQARYRSGTPPNFKCGGGRIRTYGALQLGGFQDRWFKPLTHTSKYIIYRFLQDVYILFQSIFYHLCEFLKPMNYSFHRILYYLP